MENWIDFISLLTLISGFVIGLGAVTVIDVHGFLGMKSSYWTEATIRTHKVTKPLIWLGTFLAVVGGSVYYRNEPLSVFSISLASTAIVLILNGLFLTLKVSPYLLKREKQGKSTEILPKSWQNQVLFSFLLSDFGWWTALALVVYSIIF